jgi:hypothetical protein
MKNPAGSTVCEGGRGAWVFSYLAFAAGRLPALASRRAARPAAGANHAYSAWAAAETKNSFIAGK